MQIKTLLTAVLLALMPALSLAEGCARDQHAQSCATGFVWDNDTGGCVEQVTG
ncbi:hypothetical protein [Aliiroseovarius subalbicans]|uniref:hypothetical protein n=1 Tax=Aliiroseovarius subalbicans TaxID=2925840 RepID=UPI001F57632B|nr:hypothetical protein [Aliiroseovarius subalbicans]MCI2398864.1 hypothetical protein [Aliiroseovarius subalbicans]